ncbi:hypothetical protein NKH75_28495 [Mesorhizobium sp. M0984]
MVYGVSMTLGELVFLQCSAGQVCLEIGCILGQAGTAVLHLDAEKSA